MVQNTSFMNFDVPLTRKNPVLSAQDKQAYKTRITELLKAKCGLSHALLQILLFKNWQKKRAVVCQIH